MLHHIAIGTNQLDKMFSFYQNLPGIRNIQKNITETGHFRSFWVFFSSPTILMIEEKKIPKAPEALVFSVFDDKGEYLDFSSIKPYVVEMTEYTIYFQDPDENKLGYSSYPEPIRF